MSELKIQIPSKLEGLFVGDARYRIAYGGRGSSKSWSVAQMLIVKALTEECRILCCREFQNSIKDSSLRLLAGTIRRMGVTDMFEVLETTIRCKTTGADFIFKGLRRNAEEIKSTEGIKYAWVEEGDKTSKRSWGLLTPTIRMPGSEIWVTYNPEDEESHIHQEFVIQEPPSNARVVKINWSDNPWFPKELDTERLALKARDLDDYNHVWEGEVRKALEGTYYAKILADMRDAGQITVVPHDATGKVYTIWDIGMSDDTVIWFYQQIGFQRRIIDHYSMSGEDLSHYAKVINSKPYSYKEHILPHDARQRRIGMTVPVHHQLEELINEGEVVTTDVTRDVNADIQACRLFLKQCYFDKDNCSDGLKSLRNYKRKWNEDRQVFGDKPEHNWASHDADAFRYLAKYFADEDLMTSESTIHNSNIFKQQNQEDDYGTLNDYF